MPWPVRSLLLVGANYRKTSPGELSGHIESKYAAFIRQKAALMDPALPAILAGHSASVAWA